jgi:mycoredoxin-dependent peroxiredoxin
MTLQIGDPAPEFSLRDTEGTTVTLAGLLDAGSVTLVFIPFAFTSVCQGELCELRDHIGDFDTRGNTIVAVTCDAGPSLGEWKRQQEYQFPLLTDFWPHGEVARSYGCFNDAIGCADRLSVVIGKDGRVVDQFRSGGLGEARPLEKYTEALGKL